MLLIFQLATEASSLKHRVPWTEQSTLGAGWGCHTVGSWPVWLCDHLCHFPLWRFVKGFINRDKPLCPDNEEFVVLVRKNYILNLRYHVPKSVLDQSWLRPPGILENVSGKWDAAGSAAFQSLDLQTCLRRHGLSQRSSVGYENNRHLLRQGLVTVQLLHMEARLALNV